MKISLEWLGEHVTWIEKNPEKIAERLTLSSAEVEEIIQQGKLLNHCCVGEIVSLAKHPNADKLSLVTVKTDKGEKKVVCGGTNLSMGMKIAFAHVGATVKHGDELLTLSQVKIRGEESNGMICAAEELGLETQFPPKKEDGERPIADLGTMKAGQSLKDALGGGDAVLDINNTAITTRPDLWSHIGFARECVALGLAKYKAAPKRPSVRFTKDALPFKSVVDVKKLVPRYVSCMLELNGTGETPEWMKKRLEATGWQCINLPVDITNYVAMECGIPLHAFDADEIKGTVHFRSAKKGETIVTLDNQKRTVPEGGLILSDDLGIFDLVGIMGGLRSSTTEKTRRVLIHAAVVDPVTIRQTIQATGLRTHAATVYEKGVPPVSAEVGLRRAVELFLELVPGAKIVSKLETWGSDGKAPVIALPLDRVSSLLGTEIPEKRIVTILESLGCTVKRGGARTKMATLSVTPPLWRLRDLVGPQDLIEEIGRVNGFENVAEERPRGVLRPLKITPIDFTVRTGLAARGYAEILPLSLVGSALLKKVGMDPAKALAIKNPLNEDLSLMQPSTLPQLLAHAEIHRRGKEDALRTFHAGHVFSSDGKESAECGVLIAGSAESGLLHDPFLHVLKDITDVLAGMHHTSETSSLAQPLSFMHPGRAAEIRVGAKLVGHAFELHPTICRAFDLPHRSAVALLDVSAVEALNSHTSKTTTPPNLPAIRYDLTFAHAHTEPMGKLLQKLRTASPLLEQVDVIDLYDGKNVPAGKYSATLRFTYRAKDRTLTEEEAKKEHEKVLSNAHLSVS